MNKPPLYNNIPPQAGFDYELEIAEGLERIAQEELYERVGRRAIQNLSVGRGAVQFYGTGDPARLLQMKTVNAVHLRLAFDVPRPRALLGHEHFHKILHAIHTVLAVSGRHLYKTLYISAAGSESSVMTRLKEELAAHLGVSVAAGEGDLLLRVRRVPSGWDVLVRLTPRPLSTRDWRVCNMEGALNASVAHAMLRMCPAAASDVVVNVGCGSGTFLIEQMSLHRTQHVIGFDNAPDVLAMAQKNIAAAGYTSQTNLVLADAGSLPLPDHTAALLCADLPFGQRVGSHETNRTLYPRILLESWRVARPLASFVVITHEIRLLQDVLSDLQRWEIATMLTVTLRGLHPRIYVLRKSV